MLTQFVLDAGRTAGEISPFWFGHNLEHTRSCVWRGLSAELLRNRKFSGLPQHDGVAGDWYGIGPRESWHLVEIAGGWAGTASETFTQRWFDEGVKPCCQQQRAESYVRGPCGIGQRGIPLVGGRAHEGRLTLKADRPLDVRVTISGAAPASKRLRVGPDGWTEAAWKFKVARTNLGAKIEITFNGPGAIFVGAASLLPAGHFHGMRADVVDLLKEIGTPMLRWPGGNFAGYYRWRDGLLPVDRRAAAEGALDTLPHTGGFDTHEIGTDEFIALCRAIGAEPFLTINMSLEGPAEAAAWVEYCNGPADSTWGRRRAERGHPEPYGVRYWTLGNEMGYGHMKGDNTASGYTKAAADCARAMKAVDPSLILVGSTGWAKKWYEDVLALDEVFDHISLHTYHPLIRDYTGDTGRAEFRKLTDLATQNFLGTGLVNGEQQTRLTMADMRAIINARPRGRKDIGIAFDEWNVWYAWYR
jgi:alpha-N-arabinofuranosidase